MSKQKYIYALMHKKKGTFLLEDGKLPIYWSRKWAKNRCKLFKEFIVYQLPLNKIEDIFYTSKPITK